MPMTRYEIRNEYSLADPDLYRAADKDDPEALLEGVAMAGLVGVLRQLGDLAEFAAEIFHNLHEEVMATAARGHGLMVRVQQLETEIPSIERAFLSQTDHSSFFYHAGLDWHPNLRQDQNLVTQGDLPRFIMDSYEDCRAPPRLFLLDKFDVAGAGSCLKRYTDPSFFKVEASEITNTDVQREKKIRKAKKKGPRWRNGETPEVLPTSHTSKLHQLFLEERVENGVRNLSSRVKLKRRLNGFPFDSKTGKSYMETLLKSPSPDHKVLHEVTVNSSPVMSTTNKESGFKIYEVQPLSPDRVSGGRNRSPPSSVDDEPSTVNPSMYEPNKFPINDEPCEAPNSYPSIAADGISSTLEKVVAMDAESYREGSLNGYQSDDIASEIDNYVDAPSTMESEVDGDSELRVKSDITSPHIKSGSLISDADEEHLHIRSSDSQSTGDSIIFDEGNNSLIKEMSSFSSDSPTTSAEKPEAENNSVKGFQYDDIPVNEMVNASSYQKTADEEFQVNDQSKPVGSDDTCTVTNAITNCSSEFEQLTASLCNYGSIPASMHSASEEVRKCMLKAPESDEIISTLNDNEKKADLAIDPPCSPSHCGSVSQSEDDSPGSSAGEHLVDEPSGKSLPWRTTVPDNNCHTADSLVKMSLDSLHECESDEKDRNMVGKITSTSNVLNDLSMNDTSDTISSKNQVPGKLEDEFPFPENSPDCPVTAHNGDNIESAVFEEDNLIDVLDDGSANGSTDSPNHFPCITEASLEKQLHETSFADSQTANVEENCSSSSTDNQINSENLKSWNLVNLVESPDKPVEGLDAHAVDVIPEEETTINEILALETLKPCEGGGLQGIGLTHHDFHNDSEALESSPCILEDLEMTAGTEDTAEMDGVSLCSSNTGREVTEVSGTADLNSVNAVHILLDTFDSEIDKSNTTLPAVSDNVSLNKLVKEHNNCFENSCLDELENEEKCPSECDGKSDIVEDVGSTDASAPGFELDFCNAVNNDHPESKVSGIVPNSNLVLEVDRDLNLVHAAMIESPVEQYGIDGEQELYEQSDHGNPVPDALSLSVDYDAGEAIAQEKIESPLDQLDQKLPNPDEMSSKFSPLLPTHHQQILNNDDCMQDKDSSPVLSLVECQGSPPFSELSRQSNHEIDVPEYSKDPLGFIFPPSNPFSEKNQINLTDLQPLPPLPPVEWRMGKLLNFSSSTEGELMKHNDLSPQLISPLAVPSGTVNSSMPPTSTDDTGSSPPPSSTIDIYSIEETNNPLIETTPETASKEENGENSCSSLEANSLHETADLPPKLKDERYQIIMPMSEGASTSPPEENGVENGSQTVKLPRPRNPLVGDVAVLDKSKLRKVTERVRPEIQKVDERDSLLEQIRTKSFNLKPAMPTRPSIRGGPSTNLNVAAMLEKANAIRQAFAGSDEDDSDSWSDS